MENENNYQIPTPQQVSNNHGEVVMPQAPVTNIPSAPVTNVPNTETKPRSNPFKNIKDKLNNLSPRNKMMAIIALVLFAVILVLLLLVALFAPKKKVSAPTPKPTPISVSPTPNVVLNASKYATDSGVLKIESELNNIQSDLQKGDVRQSDLNIPNLDYNVNFNK